MSLSFPVFFLMGGISQNCVLWNIFWEMTHSINKYLHVSPRNATEIKIVERPLILMEITFLWAKQQIK
jgi:hypothetical protein